MKKMQFKVSKVFTTRGVHSTTRGTIRLVFLYEGKWLIFHGGPDMYHFSSDGIHWTEQEIKNLEKAARVIDTLLYRESRRAIADNEKAIRRYIHQALLIRHFGRDNETYYRWKISDDPQMKAAIRFKVNMLTVKGTTDSDSCAQPLANWPLVQPWANRAPRRMRIPPMKPATNRLPMEPP